MRTVFREDHEQFRETARRFVDKEIVPHLHEWEHAGIVPKSLWRKAGETGLLCSTVPEAYGGSGGDFGHSAVMIEELARANATAVGFTTHSEIVTPYIVACGSEEQKQRWLPRMVSGELIGVIAMSEPGIGSDLRAMRTTAKRGLGLALGELELGVLEVEHGLAEDLALTHIRDGFFEQGLDRRAGADADDPTAMTRRSTGRRLCRISPPTAWLRTCIDMA